jgi:hypothetical protein
MKVVSATVVQYPNAGLDRLFEVTLAALISDDRIEVVNRGTSAEDALQCCIAEIGRKVVFRLAAQCKITTEVKIG